MRVGVQFRSIQHCESAVSFEMKYMMVREVGLGVQEVLSVDALGTTLACCGVIPLPLPSKVRMPALPRAELLSIISMRT